MLPSDKCVCTAQISQNSFGLVLLCPSFCAVSDNSGSWKYCIYQKQKVFGWTENVVSEMNFNVLLNDVTFQQLVSEYVRVKYLPTGRWYSSRLRKFCSLSLSLRFFSRRKCSLSLVFRVVLMTDVLLQLDHISGTTYLPVCEIRKSAAKNSGDNWRHSCLRRTEAHRDFFWLLHLINILTYLL